MGYVNQLPRTHETRFTDVIELEKITQLKILGHVQMWVKFYRGEV